MSHSTRKKEKSKASDEEKSKYFEEESATTKLSDANAADANAKPPEHGTDTKVIITEIRGLRKEISDSLDKLSGNVAELDQTVCGLSSRISEVEDRVSGSEDGQARAARLLSHLMRRDRQTEARCEALENAQRRGNLRLYGVKEDSEEGDTVKWVEQFLRNILSLPQDFSLKLERAHRSRRQNRLRKTRTQDRSC